MTTAIERQIRRRGPIEPVIGHLKNEHRMGRNYLAQGQGDAINAILVAAGYNFRLPLKTDGVDAPRRCKRGQSGVPRAEISDLAAQ